MSGAVVVVGAGPAGAAAAARLARGGRDVVLVHGAPAAAPLGECLPAAAADLLRDLGLAEVLGPPHRPCLGNAASWGHEGVTVLDSVRDPRGHGWHLDRAAFDAALRAGAERAGARVVEARVLGVEGHVGRHGPFTVRTTAGALPAAALVDATGRSARLARALGATRQVDDALVALVARTRPGAPDPDHHTLVEAVPEGWWYVAPLPDGAHVVALHADPAEARRLRHPAVFAAALGRTRHVGARLRADLAGAPRVVHAGGTRLSTPGGPGWVAVGDAAQAFDPVGAQGVFHALWSGLRGAEALLAGDLDGYRARLARVAAAHGQQRRAAYTGEGRWPAAPFWARRSVEPGA